MKNKVIDFASKKVEIVIPFGYKKFIIIRFGFDPRIVKQTDAKGDVKDVEKVVIAGQHDCNHQQDLMKSCEFP